MKTIRTIIIIIVVLLHTPSSRATALLEQTKGSDLVNAAKMILDESFTPKSDLDKLRSLYALGFIEGLLASDIYKETTHEQHKADFDLGKDGEIGVYRMILEYVEGSRTLESAPGPHLIHGLLCIRYGTSKEVRSMGTKILLGITAIEGKKILEELERDRKAKEAEQ